MPRRLALLATAAGRRWRRTLALTLALLAALAGLGALAGGGFTNDFRVPGTESQRAVDLLAERFPELAGDTGTVVVQVPGGQVRDERTAIEAALARVVAQPDVTAVAGPFAEAGQISRDGRTAFAVVQYDRPAGELPEARAGLEAAVAPLAAEGVRVELGGPVMEETEVALGATKVAGLALAALLIAVLLRSTLAMTATLVAAGLGLAGGLLVVTLAGAFVDVPVLASSLAIMLGLGVGIDYGLFLAHRFRGFLDEGDRPLRALARANATSGVAVLAAAAIVLVALAGLVTTGIPFIGWMALATAISVATSSLAAVVLVPALLGAAGSRIRPRGGRVPERPGRLARLVVRRPLPAALAATAALAVLAVPALDMRLGLPDDGARPESATQRQAYDLLARNFGPGVNGPLVLAVDLRSAERPQAALERLGAAAAADPAVAAVTAPLPNRAGDAAVLQLAPAGRPQDEETAALVERLREQTLPAALEGTGARALVGGYTATQEDFASRLGERLPLLLASVLAVSAVLLAVVFRSLWVPLAAVVMNLASALAAFGAVVAVFQWGWLNELFGLDATVPISSAVPVFLFALLFGLSTDYAIFLLSRVRERFGQHADARASVLEGLTDTRRVILTAAAVMAVTFGGFAWDDNVQIQMFGLGLALAVLIDVALVRMVLAPAVMVLLGDRAWALPAGLARRMPELHVEGRDPGPEPPAAPAPRPLRENAAA